jgi:hypothetical protein
MLDGAALPQDDFDDLELELDSELDGYDPSVPGMPGLLMGLVFPKPYPINIYNFDGRKESGLAGTLEPDGTFRPLPTRNIPRGGEHWDEEVKAFLPHTVVWDGVVTGCVDLSLDPDEPSRRTCDGSVIGPWPLHPPKPDRLVSVEGARAAALENETDMRESSGGLL